MEEISLGELIKTKRKELGLTQVALSKSISCSEDYIIKLEKNKRYPSKEIAENLAKNLDLPFEDIWSRTKKIKLETLEIKHNKKKEYLTRDYNQSEDDKILDEAIGYLKHIFSSNNKEKKSEIIAYLKDVSKSLL